LYFGAKTKNGNNSQNEAIAATKFCKLLIDKFDFVQIRDNTHNDLALQFKSKKTNKLQKYFNKND